MPDIHDIYGEYFIKDIVDNPVIPHTDAVTVTPLQFLTAMGSVLKPLVIHEIQQNQ